VTRRGIEDLVNSLCDYQASFVCIYSSIEYPAQSASKV
jgi:hypothetical protein